MCGARLEQIASRKRDFISFRTDSVVNRSKPYEGIGQHVVVVHVVPRQSETQHPAEKLQRLFDGAWTALEM